MSEENGMDLLGAGGCRKVAWTTLLILALFLSLAFLISGVQLILREYPLSPDCVNLKHANNHVKRCEAERLAMRFMINTGYAMTCAGALFGLTFLVIGGWLLVGMVRRAGRHYPEPEDPTLDNERSNEIESTTTGPPDYATACRAPQIQIDDDSVSYRPPPYPPLL